jgi:hypothetical protein
MRAWPIIARLTRPALAVAALYAFVLGTYLGALAPAQLSAPGHVLCSPAGDAGSPPAWPAADHRDCCTAACPGGTSPVAPPVSGTLVPPRRDLVTFAWTPEAEQVPRTASIGDARARGPPHA